MRQLLLMLALAVLAPAASGQAVYGPPALPPPEPDPQVFIPRAEPVPPGLLNPMALLGDAAQLLPGFRAPEAVAGGQLAGGPDGPVPPPGGAAEQSPRRGLTVALNIMVLLTVISLVPSVMIMTTSFVRILVVLSLLRQAIGTQGIPPAQVTTGLALFLTVMIMGPTIDRVWSEAVVPWQNNELGDYGELWDRAERPLRDFMFDQIEATGNWSSVFMLLNHRGVDTSDPGALTRADVPTSVLVPAYMLSELKVGFLMGFRVYLPFLVIDMVIASVLISMSMMMLPPVLISLPFKLLLFVLVDGWTLVVGSVLESFVADGLSPRMSAEQAACLLLIAWPARAGRGGEGSLRPGGAERIGRLPCSTTRPRSTSCATR